VTVAQEGVEIHEYVAKTDDRDSSEERGTAFACAAGITVPPGLFADEAYEGVPG
jgi:hypothetical protein